MRKTLSKKIGKYFISGVFFAKGNYLSNSFHINSKCSKYLYRGSIYYIIQKFWVRPLS
eukprot:UN20177